MSDRFFPVRPDLDQLKHQAKDLLRAIHRGDAAAIAELQQHHPQPPESASAKLADAQVVLARSYGAPSWPRLVQSCRSIDAIWQDDFDTVRELVVKNPELLRENAGIRNNNWGPPMSHAAPGHSKTALGSRLSAFSVSRELFCFLVGDGEHSEAIAYTST